MSDTKSYIITSDLRDRLIYMLQNLTPVETTDRSTSPAQMSSLSSESSEETESTGGTSVGSDVQSNGQVVSEQVTVSPANSKHTDSDQERSSSSAGQEKTAQDTTEVVNLTPSQDDDDDEHFEDEDWPPLEEIGTLEEDDDEEELLNIWVNFEKDNQPINDDIEIEDEETLSVDESGVDGRCADNDEMDEQKPQEAIIGGGGESKGRFVCDYCGQAFCYIGWFNRHVKRNLCRKLSKRQLKKKKEYLNGRRDEFISCANIGCGFSTNWISTFNHHEIVCKFRNKSRTKILIENETPSLSRNSFESPVNATTSEPVFEQNNYQDPMASPVNATTPEPVFEKNYYQDPMASRPVVGDLRSLKCVCGKEYLTSRSFHIHSAVCKGIVPVKLPPLHKVPFCTF